LKKIEKETKNRKSELERLRAAARELEEANRLTKEPKSMIQGENFIVHGGNFTSVRGDYHEHRNTTYVTKEPTMHSKYLKIFKDTVETELKRFFSSAKEDNKTPHPTSEEGINFDDDYYIYQTPTPINDFAPYSMNSDPSSSSMTQDGHISPTENQQPYPFGYMPVLIPGIVHYLPCWLPLWGGWIASWTTWVSPPSWVWPSFL